MEPIEPIDLFANYENKFELNVIDGNKDASKTIEEKSMSKNEQKKAKKKYAQSKPNHKIVPEWIAREQMMTTNFNDCKLYRRIEDLRNQGRGDEAKCLGKRC